MAAFSSIALAVGAAATVGGTLYAANQQRRAASAAERQAEAQQQQQTVATRRSRRQAIRRQQIARAQAISSAQGSGSLRSSGASGGIGALTSQLGEQLGYSSQQSNLSGIISEESRNIAEANQAAQLGSSIAGLGQSAMTFGMNRGATFGNLWSSIQPNRPPQTSIRPQARPV